MKHVIVSLAITAMLFSSLGLRQADRRAEPRPNIIFILVDDLRWDELGITGHPFIKTTNIDRIGSEGVLFRNAFDPIPTAEDARRKGARVARIRQAKLRKARKTA